MEVAAWKLPVFVAAIAISIVGGFYLGGPGLGMAVGGLAAATIVVMAVRNPPLPPIAPAAAGDGRRHLLVALECPLEGEALDALASVVRGGVGEPPAEVRLIAPSRHRFLDRWASELGPGRDRAQRTLVLSAASLAAAAIDATARVGDEDLVQMVEDELRSFPATEVVLIGGEPDTRPAIEARRALEARLRPGLRTISARSDRPDIFAVGAPSRARHH